MSILDTVAEHPAFKWISIASAVVFVLSLAAIPVVIARIPEDYFTEAHQNEKRTGGRLALAVVLTATLFAPDPPGAQILVAVVAAAFVALVGWVWGLSAREREVVRRFALEIMSAGRRFAS